MAHDTAGARPGAGLSAHILPTSATMIGVCLTALYISLLGPSSESRMLVDKLLALDTGCLWGGCLSAARLLPQPDGPAQVAEIVQVDCPQARKPGA